MANGSQLEIDENLGNFYTARQYLKFYGQNWNSQNLNNIWIDSKPL
jgi:hypothetical protein